MQLRYYQADCVAASYEYAQTHSGNFLNVIPTGGGKTPIIGTIAKDVVERWGGRVAIISHVKELLEQAEETISRFLPSEPVGVYSAGLGRRELDKRVTIAGIQSIYHRAHELGPVNLVIVDEAHLIPIEGEGMYRQFIKESRIVRPQTRLMGLTATPYRSDSGLIYGPGMIFEDVAYEISVAELISQGFLSPLRSKRGLDLDFSSLHLQGGEFITAEVEELWKSKTGQAVSEIVRLTQDRNSVLIFSASVPNGVDVCNLLYAMGQDCELITGDSTDEERADAIRRFKAGSLKYLVNYGVLTTGFDACNVDCLAILRVTNSLSLFVQIMGRGLRLFPGKKDCLVLDFGGNIERHGPIDAIEPPGSRKSEKKEAGEAPGKTCPNCKEVVAASRVECPECGYIWPPSGPKHEETSSEAAPVASIAEPEIWEEEVIDVVYSAHLKKGAGGDHPKTLRVEYMWGPGNWDSYSDWICVEHSGWAGGKAQDWWKQRTDHPFVNDAEAAAKVGNRNGLAAPYSITVCKQSGKKYPEIIGYDLGPKVVGLSEGFPDIQQQPETQEPVGVNAQPDLFSWGIDEEDVPF
ncbi:type I restriction enzyme EcoKI subunit R [Thalassoglobus neptunius]|uniref:Type I restriction enzyme EcoKI subunit R n=1 Tax=Thalassoglobus neptunius TaxID=1938619 RepID=A0A5C5WNM9_9PLAN|nr:DEAD/DEAH box helicase [Thalassoglobus neptunius]TWT51815.1 type I restriction enzyme EcoKI subunit R [Thalassoglobus neptunius]